MHRYKEVTIVITAICTFYVHKIDTQSNNRKLTYGLYKFLFSSITEYIFKFH